MKQALIVFGRLVLLCGLLGGFLMFLVGLAVVSPRSQVVGPPPSWLPAETISVRKDGEPDLVGWIASPAQPCGVIALFHGRGGDRRQMLGRARLLFQAGFVVALFDFRAHGGSGGGVMGFGYFEARDVERVAAFLSERFGDQPLGVLGLSLGGAAAALAAPNVQANAYIFEAMYSDLLTTTARRMPIPYAQRALAWLLLLQAPILVGHWTSDLRPVDMVGEIDAPLLIIAGAVDPMATPTQTRAVFDAATEPKELLWIPKAGHEDFLRVEPTLYADAIKSFFRNTFRCEAMDK